MFHDTGPAFYMCLPYTSFHILEVSDINCKSLVVDFSIENVTALTSILSMVVNDRIPNRTNVMYRTFSELEFLIILKIGF